MGSAAENDKARNRRLLRRERSPASATKSGRVRAERRITNATRKSQTRLANARASVSKRRETSATAKSAPSAAENDKARNRRLLRRERSPASATKSDPASATKSDPASATKSGCA